MPATGASHSRCEFKLKEANDMAKFAIPLALAAALSLSATTTAPALAKSPKAERNCFWTNSVSSFSAVDDKTVNIRVGVKDYYRLDLMGGCPDIDWNTAIALESRGSSYICTGLDATVISPSPIGPRRCPVQSIHKL